MTSLFEAARLMWCPGIAGSTGKPDLTMQKWLATSDFAPNVNRTHLLLEGVDRDCLLQALAGDINRVSTAASESLHNIVKVPSMPKSMGWLYVKLYYSALFYAHSLLRIWGKSPSYLKTSDLLRVRQVCVAYGVQLPFQLQTGQFNLTILTNGSALSIEPEKGGGGTHDSIWRSFLSALTEFSGKIEESPFVSADKVMLSSQLTEAKNY